MTPYLVTLLVMGLMCGSELNVAAFAHPTLNRQPLETHILMRASFARLLGRVMPFWMAGSALLNLSLLMPNQHLSPEAWRLALMPLQFKLSRFPFRSSDPCRSTIASSIGPRNLFPTTGNSKSIAGTCITGCEPSD